MDTALIVTRTGGPEVLEVQERETPAPGPGQVLVALAAAGVNFIDVYQREGTYPVPTPYVPGMEGSGTVIAVGDGVEHLAEGDRVAWAMTIGACASRTLVPADSAVRVPDGVELETAAAAMLQGMTAHFLATSTCAVGPGTTALVHAAAGGVGQLLVQLLRARGASVIATAGSRQKCETARSRGADHVIDYTQVEDLAAEVRRANDDKGVDVVYDGVGAATFDASLASLRPRGLLALFGAASGSVPPFDIQRLNQGGSLFLTRPSLAHHVLTRDELEWRAGEVMGAIADGSLDVAIGGRYPFADAAAAYGALEGRETQGKLILVP